MEFCKKKKSVKIDYFFPWEDDRRFLLFNQRNDFILFRYHYLFLKYIAGWKQSGETVRVTCYSFFLGDPDR